MASFKEVNGDPHQQYEFKQTLGTGAFGVVKLALCRNDNTKWAVKCIDQRNMSPTDLEGLKEEISILGLLQHKNIVRLREVYHQPNQSYLIMEPMFGGELFDRIVKKNFYTESEACDAICVVADAIQYCHSKGIVHRDLKPENLLYASDKDDARLAVADFGLAKRVLSIDELMISACGTPGYVAPEVLEQKGYDAKADYWSLGVIAYILLCGFPPFYDENNAALFQSIKTGSVSKYSKIFKNIKQSKSVIGETLVVFSISLLLCLFFNTDDN
jgi:calcium/calmodulin-dependent protein kinase I